MQIVHLKEVKSFALASENLKLTTESFTSYAPIQIIVDIPRINCLLLKRYNEIQRLL